MEILLKKKESTSFIDEEGILRVLREQAHPSSSQVRDVLDKAKEKRGLLPEEVATLLNCEDEGLIKEIFLLALCIKEEIYGKRLVLFAPLYISNRCRNNCLYCAFRRDNRSIIRKTLTLEELREEVQILEGMGHKRLIVVYGEHPSTGIDFMVETIRTIYQTKYGRGEIRRVNVNAAPLRVEELRRLKEVGIGTFQVFQETYHRPTYESLHPEGTIKHNYLWRLYSLDRAMEAGIDDVGIGALFGLYNWRFEVMGLIYHARHLEERFGVGPHTISFPRLCKALDTPFLENPEYRVEDEDFKRLVAIIRLAVPYTGMILTAREDSEIRKKVIPLGVSQTDAGTRIGIGGYKETYLEHIPEREQFQIGDPRSLDEFVKEISNWGYIPSWCTACYRLGRTGDHFMGFAKRGFIKNFCHPNALFTFAEYLEDYASPETKRIGENLIKKELEKIPQRRKQVVKKRLAKIREGERDLYF
ncbi:[FeFe] hydrogenase H-cluster radical SAM maturase HydG [bacterium]|nr:[FeFe] hydrogenase H-cluster radical SAM maturase HydG [bacterium]MCG2676444.1 [FeFe] hydrogenase H-cluster radical SAM maturase HydG [bacterium]MCG2678307.1 [FeFe] hydrogenase H-cluster radical SAM maturase HydG [bacterium]